MCRTLMTWREAWVRFAQRLRWSCIDMDWHLTVCYLEAYLRSKRDRPRTAASTVLLRISVLFHFLVYGSRERRHGCSVLQCSALQWRRSRGRGWARIRVRVASGGVRARTEWSVNAACLRSWVTVAPLPLTEISIKQQWRHRRVRWQWDFELQAALTRTHGPGAWCEVSAW